MHKRLSRREMIARSGMGFGTLALGDLLAESTSANRKSPLEQQSPHFAPKAKRVIHLFMNGGPSQVDTFDPKPALEKHNGKRPPSADLKTERKTGGLLMSPFKFQKYGRPKWFLLS